MKKYFFGIVIVIVAGLIISLATEKKDLKVKSTVCASKPLVVADKPIKKNPIVNISDRLTKAQASARFLGTNKAGEKYTYDAAKVADRLKNSKSHNGKEKIVFITFDDGASNTVTPKVLKILRKEKVKATFFVIGQMIIDGGVKARSLIKQIYNDGNAIGNHTYCHKYHYLFPERSLNLEHFLLDIEKTDNLLKDILGKDFATRVVRCPGGIMSWNNMDELDENFKKINRVAIDWNALSLDAEGKKKSAGALIRNVINQSRGKNMVVLLMHDTYGKEATARALPSIIHYFKKQGYQFKTLK